MSESAPDPLSKGANYLLDSVDRQRYDPCITPPPMIFAGGGVRAEEARPGASTGGGKEVGRDRGLGGDGRSAAGDGG